ncbi:MAG: hypothetical protein HYW90_02990 [Candidatus Sungbacteria bacterium]|nr:hypothetical protein [Candidatus Sungbacteria bacterium]
MAFDAFLENLPLVGFYFERAYAFWQQHIAVANVTHAVFGFGLALLIFTRHKLVGAVLVFVAVVMHVIAFAV